MLLLLLVNTINLESSRPRSPCVGTGTRSTKERRRLQSRSTHSWTSPTLSDSGADSLPPTIPSGPGSKVFYTLRVERPSKELIGSQKNSRSPPGRGSLDRTWDSRPSPRRSPGASRTTGAERVASGDAHSQGTGAVLQDPHPGLPNPVSEVVPDSRTDLPALFFS